MHHYIGPEGPRTAKLAIVAEKPHREEVNLKRPLVGFSGKEVNDLLRSIGTSRGEVYLTNAVKTVTHWDNPTLDEIKAEQLELYRELASLPEVNCLVPMGRVALMALTNFKHDDIMNRRGSIYRSFIGIKIVPTLHPSFYARGEWRYKPIVKFDLARALQQSEFPELRQPRRKYIIEPDKSDILHFTEQLCLAPRLAFDIECSRGGYISCISFSPEPSIAYSFPITHTNGQPYWSMPEDEVYVWRCIQRILANPKCTYITQNGMFDCYMLWRHGILTPHMASGYDTMLMHKLLAPDLPHDLGFLTSIYTEEPYYKDESGSWDKAIPIPDEQFWVYNCKDAAVTMEIAGVMIEDLQEAGLLDQYRREVQAQWDCVADMSQIGIRVDTARLVAAKTSLLTDIQHLEKQLQDSIGWVPNTKSKADLERLVNQLGIIPNRTATGRVASDKEQIMLLANKYPEHRQLFMLIRSINEKRTLLEGFTGMAIDSRGYYHPRYKICHTKTRRLASEGSYNGGPQLQNIPHQLRGVFIPDP